MNEVSPRDRVELTHRTKGPDGKPTDRVFTAVIDFVEDNGNYFYVAYRPDDIANGLHGCCRLYKGDSPKPFGMVAWRVIGRKHVDQPRLGGNGWMVRHPGYDSMH